MPGHKNPLRPLEARARAAKLVAADRERRLTEQLQEPGPLDRFLKSFVTGNPQPAGDETQTTPALGRRIPERGAAAGRQGAGDGQRRLHAVEPVGQLIDATGRFETRRRNHFNNGSAA